MAGVPEGFRKIAISMPDAVESAHMGHPDFRVNGKIFATLFVRDGIEWGMVKLSPDQQRRFVRTKREIFQPIKGGWGRKGCTQVCLDAADPKSLREVIFTAWCNIASPQLFEELPFDDNSRVKKTTPRPEAHGKKPASIWKSVKKTSKKRKH